jgi:lipoyl(octanoyl) transferase
VIWTPLTHRNISFQDLERVQDQCRTRVTRNPDEGFLLVSEPAPTFTVGISGSAADLLWDADTCNARGIAIQKVHRGGKWTYHGPGQVVVYPVFKLNHVFPRSRVRGYLNAFRTALQTAIARELTAEIPGAALFSEAALPTDDSAGVFGLYVGQPAQKLASFGVGIQRGICSSGAAVYHTGSQFFSGIVPCGVASPQFTTLTALGWKKNWLETSQILVHQIAHDFETARSKEFATL